MVKQIFKNLAPVANDLFTTVAAGVSFLVTHLCHNKHLMSFSQYLLTAKIVHVSVFSPIRNIAGNISRQRSERKLQVMEFLLFNL